MTGKQASTALFDAETRLDHLPREGRVVSLTANRDQRAALAARLKVLSIEDFRVAANVRPIAGGAQVSGTLNATVEQACVVSFEPVAQTIEEPIARTFLHGPDPHARATAGSETFVDLEGEDLPDHFEGNCFDLEPLLVETLALALDPFPHHPDAGPLPETADDDTASPFAVLATLNTSENE